MNRRDSSREQHRPSDQRRAHALRLVTAAALGFILLISGCTDGENSADDKPGIVDAPEVEEDERVPEGSEVVPTDLQSSQCFNQYEILLPGDDELLDLTTLVDCRRPHDGQIFSVLEHPAAAGVDYPGDSSLDLWAELQCYDRFEAFVGVVYELSVLEIGTIRPNEENWDAGPYRGVHCYVHSPGGQLSGFMGGSEL